VKELFIWFKQHQRSFPWREERSPYRVWISEVMLQQTRASVVISYFLKWMERFPDVDSLANASIEEVIKMWEGLGYYNRARNLHLGAKQILERFNGKIPDTKEELSEIYGLGPYTTNAILSFGFHQRKAPVDGNVSRVVTRYFAIQENISRVSVKREVEEKAECLLDEKEPWITAEALIELGATICIPKPRCDACPLKNGCLARQKNITESLPISNKESRILELFRTVVVIESNEMFLVRKGEKGKVMADLYEFPYFEGKIDPKKWVKTTFGMNVFPVRSLKQVIHSFTKYKATLFPMYFNAKETQPISGWEWVRKSELTRLPFSSGHRRILEQIL